jgi:hypothetical protein
MAYVPGNLIFLFGGPIEGGWREWLLLTTDSAASVLAPGYITDAAGKGLLVGDVVRVVNQSAASIPSLLWTQVSALNANGSANLTSVPVSSGLAFPRNLIDGGDFTVNPWQRGTSFTAIAATATYTADRFFVAGADASVSAKAARVAFSGVAGFSQAFRFGRTANASSLSAITAGQVLESADSIRAQGQPVTLSFWAASEANFSAASNLLGVTVVQGNGSDQSAASALAGTWTAQTNAVSSTQALTATMTRYSFTGTVSSATTQLAVLLSYTPVGSAGAADSVLIEGVQLEVGPAASAFEHRDVEVELALCQRYAFVINEPASGVAIAPAVSTASNKFAITIPLPTPMRAAPTVTVANGSFGFQFANAYLAGTSLTATASAAQHTSVALGLSQLATAASNNAAVFVGGGGVGSIIANADY